MQSGGKDHIPGEIRRGHHLPPISLFWMGAQRPLSRKQLVTLRNASDRAEASLRSPEGTPSQVTALSHLGASMLCHLEAAASTTRSLSSWSRG